MIIAWKACRRTVNHVNGFSFCKIWRASEVPNFQNRTSCLRVFVSFFIHFNNVFSLNTIHLYFNHFGKAFEIQTTSVHIFSFPSRTLLDFSSFVCKLSLLRDFALFFYAPQFDYWANFQPRERRNKNLWRYDAVDRKRVHWTYNISRFHFIGASLKRAPQLRVDSAFCHDRRSYSVHTLTPTSDIHSWFTYDGGLKRTFVTVECQTTMHMLTSSKKIEKLDIPGTREMQGIVGQASDFCWGCLKDRLNSPARDLMKKDRKNQRRATLWYGFFFLREHISPRTSSTVVRPADRCL